MHNKIKAMLATLGIIVGGSTAIYMFLTYTRAFLGLIMFLLLIFGARELYHALVGHYNEMDRLKKKQQPPQEAGKVFADQADIKVTFKK